ncbi:MAG: single-stranded-DNA-specific exonuclease RecJ [Patescibacteria group bacterium]|nr:single-stranded-DNA-specific exonuclease RecJ [Patescibacteria group bacterium]
MPHYVWKIKNKDFFNQVKGLEQEEFLSRITQELLKQRGIENDLAGKEFLNPSRPADLPLSSFGLSSKNLKRATNIILSAIEQDRPIIIHGDFDADGVCATAILWKTIYHYLGYEKCLPFIPDRFEQGYGISEESLREITNNKFQITNEDQKGLLITVDCGITAEKEINMAQEMGWQVLITDHHQKSEDVPKVPTLWTDKICGAGVAWLIARRLVELRSNPPHSPAPAAERLLGLVALATVADVEPLLGANRSFVKYGLEVLNESPCIGVQELMNVAGVEKGNIGTYELGWLLAPRINSAGRLASAMDSLRLLCATDRGLARQLARKLNRLNRERQDKTDSMLSVAQKEARVLAEEHKLLVVSHQNFHEGVIGLVANKLSREFSLPSVAISENGKVSKGSARSVSGFNIIEALREMEHLLDGVGGHPMAAGFTIKTELVQEFKKEFLELASRMLAGEDLKPELVIDMQIPPSRISWGLWQTTELFKPYGCSNPAPTFVSTCGVTNVDAVGRNGNHLKITVQEIEDAVDDDSLPASFEVIGFGMGHKAAKLQLGDVVRIVYSLLENKWNGKRSLELKAKDIRKVHSSS